MKGFREKLKARQEEINGVLCVGLDPLPEKLPESLATGSHPSQIAHDITEWMKAIVDATAPYATMFKPQKAHWEAFVGGDYALAEVITYIHKRYPGIVVFEDCKRGDIGRTQERYRMSVFEFDGADGANFSPYMGRECMEYFVDQNHKERSIVGLCYTSNPSAREIQNQKLESGEYLWEFIARRTLAWADELGVTENAGLVMAAAYEEEKGTGVIKTDHLIRCREIVGDKFWFLIPGVGTQGGFAKETVAASFAGFGSIAVNSSSDINFASSGRDFAEAAAKKAKELHLELQKGLPQ
jgi:orotidine-5'-phosphate decarboxylase